ncbi:hypothetical protein NDU88_004932 [Pleurodeles waltl]|uniref:Uncharacterized protein n=1 Tax=Pleurodeles waltl TaxID=8319 RepID=A0AAV7V2G7_PLEWA|nr:hypothetical protein NDU88_004932 [Pleurodeles waltl]
MGRGFPDLRESRRPVISPALGTGEAGAVRCRVRPSAVRDRTFPCRDAGVNRALPVMGAQAGRPEAGARGDLS